MTGQYSNPGAIPVDPRSLLVVNSIGLAIAPDATVRGITGGQMPLPAAALLVRATGAQGRVRGQLLVPADYLAALHGSLEAWRERLPLDVRDQYEARRAESHGLWIKNAEQFGKPT